MKALINKATNQLEQWVESGDKYDLTKYTVVDPPPGDISMLTWNGAALVTRALRPVEVRAKALNDDARLAMLRNSTPQQIHTYVLQTSPPWRRRAITSDSW